MAEEVKTKKKVRKGPIITCSIIGGVVLLVGGAMLFALSSMQKKSPTYKLQGKTYYAQISNKNFVLYKTTSGQVEATAEEMDKVEKYINDHVDTDSNAKQIKENVAKYENAASKFTDSTVKASGTSLFSYDEFDVKVLLKDSTNVYSATLTTNSNRNGLQWKKTGNEKQIITDSYTKTGIYFTIGYAHASAEDTEKPEFYITTKNYFDIGKIKLGDDSYEYVFRITYSLK